MEGREQIRRVVMGTSIVLTVKELTVEVGLETGITKCEGPNQQ